MSKHIHRSHSVSIPLYHLVCPAKYREAVLSAGADTVLREVCLEIAARYGITLLKIRTDRNRVHFLVQATPAYSPSKLVRIVTCLASREVCRRVPAVASYLWSGELWSDGTYLRTVGQHSSEGEARRDLALKGRQH